MTSFYRVFFFCCIYLRGCAGGAVPIIQRTSRPHLGYTKSLTHGMCFSPYIQCTIYHAHAKNLRAITSLSFGDLMDLAQTFEGVACYKTISVTELDLIVNIALLWLRDSLQNSVPLWCLLYGTQRPPLPRSSYLGDTMMSLRTLILNR